MTDEITDSALIDPSETQVAPPKKRKKKRTGGPVPEAFKDHLFTSDQDREKARINGAKGGQTFARNLRMRRTMAETLEILLSMPLDPGPSQSVDTLTNLREAKASNPPSGEMIVLAQVAKAMKGDTRAAEFILTTLGGTQRATVSPLDSLANALAGYTEPTKKPKKRPETDTEDGKDDGDSPADE